jgi:hypothetical protein
VNIVGPDLSYNAATGIFTINTTGVYVIDWKFAVTPVPLTFALEIDLEAFPSAVRIGGISIIVTNPTVSGSNVIYSATAGQSFRFANNSNGPISIVLTALSGPIGTLSFFRIA